MRGGRKTPLPPAGGGGGAHQLCIVISQWLRDTDEFGPFKRLILARALRHLNLQQVYSHGNAIHCTSACLHYMPR